MAEEHIFSNIHCWHDVPTDSYHMIAKLAGTYTKIGTTLSAEVLQNMPSKYIKSIVVESLAGAVYDQAKKDIETAFDSLTNGSSFASITSISYAFPPTGTKDAPVSAKFEVELSENNTAYLFGLASHAFPPNLPTQASHLAAPTALMSKLKDIHANVDCPVAECTTGTSGVRYRQTVWTMIQHLNDEHEWPREEVADWLDTLDLDLIIGEK